MPIKTLQDVSVKEATHCASAVVASCGYERRSSAIAPTLGKQATKRVAIAFKESSTILSRSFNENEFRNNNFELPLCSGNSAESVAQLISPIVQRTVAEKGVIAFDVSSMTRVWHAAIVQMLALESRRSSFDTYFIYVPGKFTPPPKHTGYNEIVAPLNGFSALALPSKPGALVMGLGYERDRALGLGEVLDSRKTLLMIPRYGLKDPYYAEVKHSNMNVIEMVDRDSLFEYPLGQPTATFGILESICGGLQKDYRVVLASLGPKLFGLICLLIAIKRPAISVWRVSSGIHGLPQDVPGDVNRAIALKVSWGP